MRNALRTTAAAVIATATAIGFAAPALAHVEVSGTDAVQGGYGVLTFRVPSESDTASTTELRVTLPDDNPILSAAVQPKAGWTATVTKKKLATPQKDDDGNQVTEYASVVDWKANSPQAAIPPEQFDMFNLSVGPLPKAASVSFPAQQFYSDGTTVNWNEKAADGQAEPEHPAPTLTLASGGGDETTAATPSAASHSAAPPSGGPTWPGSRRTRRRGHRGAARNREPRPVAPQQLRRCAALLAAAVSGLAILVLTAAPANAHAVLVASSPVDGARLENAPEAVTLTFDETVRPVPGAAQVISAMGVRADDGTAHLSADGTTIVIPLRPHLPRASYSATYRVVSADTHVVSGSITFGVGQDADAAPPLRVDGSATLTIGANIAQGAVYVGLVLGVGVALVCGALWTWAADLTRIRWLVVGGWALLGVATVMQFLLEGPRVLDVGWSGVFSTAALSNTLTSRSGVLLLVRVLLIAAMGVRLRRGGRWRLHLLGICAVGIAVTVAAAGHAGAGQQAWLATLVTAVHVLAMTVWLSGLVVLGVAVLPLRHSDDLRRWSKIAFACVTTLILSGEYQAWRQVRPMESMWSTGYGITLSIKLGIVAAMVALAYLGHRRLDPRVLRRTVPVETALGLAVVVVTTVLVSQAPARETYGPAVHLSAPLDQRSARIAIGSTRRGPTSIDVTILGSDERPVHAQAVTGTLSSDDAGIAALKVRFLQAADDQWRSSYAVVPLPGLWKLNLDVEFSTADAVVTSAPFHVW